MITRDGKLLSIHCDSAGCVHMSATSGGNSVLNSLLVRVANDGWSISHNGPKVRHFCPGCRSPDSEPLSNHIRANGKAPLGGRGSVDPSGMLSGVVVSGQSLASKVGPVLTPQQAQQATANSKKDMQRGTPGLSDMTNEERQKLAEKLDKAKSVFQLTIRLNGDSPDV